jgi:hypothetical protein
MSQLLVSCIVILLASHTLQLRLLFVLVSGPCCGVRRKICTRVLLLLRPETVHWLFRQAAFKLYMGMSIDLTSTRANLFLNLCARLEE